MKFLIAASCLCLALIGQTQGGSLRGLEVQVVHQVYGVPEVHQENPQPIADAAPKIQTVPFIDSLPLIDSVANFASTTSKPTTPELPYLQPGLPSLPEAPVPVVRVSNNYLPPDEMIPSSSPYTPSDVYGPPATNVAVEPPISPVTPEAEMMQEVPSIEEQKPSESYGPPGLPSVQVNTPSEVYGQPAQSMDDKKSEAVNIPAIPELPEAPQIPEVQEEPMTPEVSPLPQAAMTTKLHGYHYSRPAVEFNLPFLHVHQVPSVPEVHIGPQIPIITRIPVIPHNPILIEEVQLNPVSQIQVGPGYISSHIIASNAAPIKEAAVEVDKGYHYEKPRISFPPLSDVSQNLVSSNVNNDNSLADSVVIDVP